jgi:hypothetical protein
MGAYVQQLECLNCSHNRSFVLHEDREQRIVDQVEAAREAGRGVLTCARRGGTNLIRVWGDAAPYVTAATARRRQRTARLANTTYEA